LPSQFDPTNIRMQFDMTLGREARVVDETQDFFTQLLGDIRRLRQAAGRQDIEGLALAQEAAYSRIASFRFQVDQALRQLSEARASLRRLLPLGTMPPTAASSPCEQQDAGQLRESVAAASGPLAGRRQRLEEEYKDLQARYTTLTNRLRALDTGIGRETDSMNRQILEERRAEKAEKRRTVEQQLVELELQMGI
ncbi:MAG: hypothetical protein ACK2U9_06690, partial [Anaerolineae bacterium]